MLLANSDELLDTLSVPSRKTKSRRGGARPGAGRKPTLKDPVSMTLDLERPQKDALEVLAHQDGASVASLVRKAVATYLRRRGKA